jgi:hypothetical protein
VVTAAESRAYLRSAERLAAIRLGVDRQDGAPLGLTYNERVAYIAAVAALILEKPALFLPATVATARLIAGKTYSPLEDASYDWDLWVSTAADEALALGTAAASVGDGVKTALNLTSVLIPIALVAAVFIGLSALQKRAKA